MRDFAQAHPRAWDRVASLPLILFNASAAAGFAILIAKAQIPPVGFMSSLGLASEFGSFVFFALEAVLVCIRKLPLQKLEGVVPRTIALLAAYCPLVVVLLPHRVLSMPEAAVSVGLLLVGTLGGIVTLAFLGRSFAILPQARQLITNGPYRYIRHPLYLFGQTSLIGVSLQFMQPWGLIIAAACFLLQFPRMRYEEKVLLETFPGYVTYRERTAMLVPGLF
jgi:protein-S-isoprenylcysteine O-methyltransferase Ste14